jgi:nucleotide-binding universal stress UspA family protein
MLVMSTLPTELHPGGRHGNKVMPSEKRIKSMTAAMPDWNGAIGHTPNRKDERIKNVVLPLDDTEQARTALPIARKLSELYEAVLHLAYVGESPMNRAEQSGRFGLSEEQARGAVLETSSGDPAEFVVRLTHDLREPLLVMCTALGSQRQQNRFGSMAESIFSSKPQRAILLTPERGIKPWNLRRILLAHDGTPISNPAIGPAADLAQYSGAEVIALHVAARGEERPEARGSIAAPLYVDQPQHEWPAWAEEFMNRVVAGGVLRPGVHFRLKVTGGQAGSEVADVARKQDVDLVVMAWHGHWDHEDCATRIVIRNSGCPVMLVYSAG